jgi:hypothetical protein
VSTIEAVLIHQNRAIAVRTNLQRQQSTLIIWDIPTQKFVQNIPFFSQEISDFVVVDDHILIQFRDSTVVRIIDISDIRE